MDNENRYLLEAIELARVNLSKGGRPFGALVVLDDEVIATGVNEILSTNDPTAHAELSATRVAARKLGSPNLSNHIPVSHERPPSLYVEWAKAQNS